MARPQDEKWFNERLDETITEQGIIPAELARASSLHDSQISEMRKGDDPTRITKTPVRKCIEGLIRLNKITTVPDIKAWIRSYYFYREANKVLLKKFSHQEMRELEKLLDQVQKQLRADREQALKKPKYTTSRGIPVIGREQDTEEILRRLRNGERFIPIVGLLGVGKSELARQVRKEAESQRLFTSVRDLELAREAVTNPDAVIELLTKRLKGIPMRVKTLVLLHDCERVDELTGALDDFLESHKHITILATSRKQMISKKTDHPVEPLNEHEAIKLFLEIANINITEENTKQIVALCRYCGGLPLAVNLVAPSVDELGIEGLYNRFLEKGLLTLPGTLTDSDSSTSFYKLFEQRYSLLDEKEQRIFRRLGIFNWTGCSLKTARAVCDLGDLELNEDEFYNALQKLSRHFLITFLNKRVLIAYPLFQEYAWQKVRDEDEEERLYRRHADYFFTSFMDYIFLCKGDYDKITIFEQFGYNRINTYGEAVQEEIKDDIFVHFPCALDYVEQLQFKYILDNLEKITEREEYHAIKRLRDNVNNKTCDFTRGETLKISLCYEKVVSRLTKEDSNFPYPQWKGYHHCVSCFEREGRKYLIGMKTPLAQLFAGITTRIVVMPENASRMHLIMTV